MDGEYITKQGDAWDLIAYRVYGDIRYTGWLMKNNFPLLETFVFGAGTVIKTPELPASEEKSSLPPWRETV